MNGTRKEVRKRFFESEIFPENNYHFKNAHFFVEGN